MDDKKKQFDYSTLYRGFQRKDTPQEPAQPQPADEPDGAKTNYARSGPAQPRAQRAKPDSDFERLLQAEMEAQLRALGQSVTDGLRTGFDGMGEQLGSQAAKFGGAVMDVVNYSLGTASDELRKVADELKNEFTAEKNAERSKRGTSPEADPAAPPRRREYNWNFSAERKPALKSDALVRSARTRFGVGLAQVIPGGILAFGLLLGGLICVMAAPYAGAAVDTQIVGVVGASLFLAGTPFAWLTWLGGRNLGVSKRLKAYAAAIGERSSVSLLTLAEAVQKPVKKVRKDIKFLLGKGWLTGWLDSTSDVLYLSADEWRAAMDRRESAAAAPAPSAGPEPKAEPKPEASETKVDPDTIQRFAQVLGSQQQLMADETAAEELAKMQTTSRAIGEWVAAHPESAPKARRFVSYYIPTTLKLLHTYNEMQDQPGENAEAIRRDIGGILHTLNIAFENLYNGLLSDVAMDVSTEIAALQGMLAQDGLSQEQPFR